MLFTSGGSLNGRESLHLNLQTTSRWSWPSSSSSQWSWCARQQQEKSKDRRLHWIQSRKRFTISFLNHSWAIPRTLTRNYTFYVNFRNFPIFRISQIIASLPHKLVIYDRYELSILVFQLFSARNKGKIGLYDHKFNIILGLLITCKSKLINWQDLAEC